LPCAFVESGGGKQTSFGKNALTLTVFRSLEAKSFWP
jgi:hypothetical protein